MRAIACLLLALLVSSAFFGICNGAVWFEGYSPQENQDIDLSMQPIKNTRTWALPTCNLLLSENESRIVYLSIKVTTLDRCYQTEDFETWLSIDSKEPQKLVGILYSTYNLKFGGEYVRQYNVTLSGLGDGAHFIKIRVAGDYYGHQGGGNYDCEGNVSVIIDTTPPKVTILSLENKTYSTASIPLDFTTNERSSQYTYSLDGHENVTINANTTLTGLANGDHNVTVYATDEAGNIGASETIYFRIESLLTTLVIVSVVAVVVIGVGLLVYFKKRKG